MFIRKSTFRKAIWSARKDAHLAGMTEGMLASSQILAPHFDKLTTELDDALASLGDYKHMNAGLRQRVKQYMNAEWARERAEKTVDGTDYADTYSLTEEAPSPAPEVAYCIMQSCVSTPPLPKRALTTDLTLDEATACLVGFARNNSCSECVYTIEEH